MKVVYLLHNTYRQILSRKTMFLLSTILLCITFLIIMYQVLIMGVFFYQKDVVKDIIAENREDVFILDFGKYMMPTKEDSENLNKFGILMNDVEGVKYSGVCYEDEMQIKGSTEMVMTISADLSALCNLKNMDGQEVSFTEVKKKSSLPGERRNEERNVKKQPILVGYDLREAYPIGYSFTDEITEVEYVVTDILQEDSRWFEERLQYGEFSVDLDSCLVVDGDTRMKRGDDIMIGTAIFTYVKEPEADEHQVEESMIALAKECGLDLYNAHSIKEILEDNKQTVFEEPIEYYLIVIMLILALIVVIVCSVINVFMRKKSIGIMYAVGYSMRDVKAMVLLENIIKIGIAFAVSYAYWSVNEIQLFGGLDISVLRYMLPKLLICTLILIWISSILPIHQISKMYPATLIGGKE